jgi:glycerol-3-phosphate dehydrogenase (NAD(P)+)
VYKEAQFWASFFYIMDNQKELKLCIVGAGSWATALCKIFSDAGAHVCWWFHREEDAALFQETGHNPRYLSDIDFSARSVQAETDLSLAIRNCDIILIAVPSAYVSSVLKNLPSGLFKDKKVITSVKGILPEQLQLVTEYLASDFNVEENQLAVVAGPCHAEEVALEKQSYLTVASSNAEFAVFLRDLMKSRYISVKVSEDPEGVEWAAVLKNVYAIACGVCHGQGFGDNFQAVLVSNAMQEMQLFLDSYLPGKRNTLESAYLGDLLVTAYSTFSRNRTFGNMVGRGYSIRAAQVELGMVAEGYHAIKALHMMREKLGLNLPIAEAMYAVMYENAPVKNSIASLRKILS